MSVCWKPAWCECPECGPLVEVIPDDGPCPACPLPDDREHCCHDEAAS